MKVDKSKYLEARVVSENERMRYAGIVEGQDKVKIDYTSPIGDDMGYTSLELLLLSLGSCVSSTFGALLRNQGKVIKKIMCDMKGTRRQEHPTGFQLISLQLTFESENLSREDINNVLSLAEGICPVWCMIKGSTEIILDFTIIE